MTATLITVAFSHFCEKARWALDYTGIPYTESRHLPMLHWAATFRAGAGRTVPALTAAGTVLSDSTDILRWTSAACPQRSLRAANPSQQAECDALEDRFDEQLGPAVRLVGYHYAFTDRRIIIDLAERAAPRWQYATFRAVLPLARSHMIRAMGIDAASVARSLGRIRGVFDDVAQRLGDGRRYLVGERFTAADLTFAALGAPMVLPPAHPFQLPAALLPEELMGMVAEMRAHPAGAFILRMYAAHRAPRAGAAGDEP